MLLLFTLFSYMRNSGAYITTNSKQESVSFEPTREGIDEQDEKLGNRSPQEEQKQQNVQAEVAGGDESDGDAYANKCTCGQINCPILRDKDRQKYYEEKKLQEKKSSEEQDEKQMNDVEAILQPIKIKSTPIPFAVEQTSDQSSLKLQKYPSFQDSKKTKQMVKVPNLVTQRPRMNTISFNKMNMISSVFGKNSALKTQTSLHPKTPK